MPGRLNDDLARLRSAVVAALALLTGCGELAGLEARPPSAGFIAVAPQPAGIEVVVAEIGMPAAGWVAVYELDGDVPSVSGVLGQVYVPEGPSETVVVPLRRPTTPGERIAVMLHRDTGAPEVFEYPLVAPDLQDPPVDIDGAPVFAVVAVE